MGKPYRRRHIKKDNTNKKQSPVSYKVNKELTKNKMPESKRDQHGNIIYASQYVGDEKFEYWIDYNDDNQPIRYHDSRGSQWNCKYNSKGNISDFWDSSGYEEKYSYYKNNTVICTTSYGESIKKTIERTNMGITRDIFINS